jgi:hypothetical protein
VSDENFSNLSFIADGSRVALSENEAHGDGAESDIADSDKTFFAAE